MVGSWARGGLKWFEAKLNHGIKAKLTQEDKNN